MASSNTAFPFLAKLITTSLAVIIVTYFLPGVSIENALTAIILSAVLAVLNIIVKPILIFLTLPITILSLGLFLIVINALIILLAAEIVPGFTIDGFWWAVLFSLILSFVVAVLETLQQAMSGSNND
jgi:putative membrane protein